MANQFNPFQLAQQYMLTRYDVTVDGRVVDEETTKVFRIRNAVRYAVVAYGLPAQIEYDAVAMIDQRYGDESVFLTEDDGRARQAARCVALMGLVHVWENEARHQWRFVGQK